MAIDDIVRDSGDGPQDDRIERSDFPADAPTAGRSRRAADHNEVDTPDRKDVQVQTPKMGSKARSNKDDRGPFEITKSPIDVKADLEDAGVLAGLLSLFG